MTDRPTPGLTPWLNENDTGVPIPPDPCRPGLVTTPTPRDSALDPRNVGHGHVTPRPDGRRARCGGPRTCRVCQADQRFIESLTAAAAAPATPAAPLVADWEHAIRLRHHREQQEMRQRHAAELLLERQRQERIAAGIESDG